MAGRVPISPEVRAQVIAELMTGAKVNATARKYNLSPATVSRIKSEFTPETLQQIATEQKQGIADLLLILVAANVQSMKRIAENVSEIKNIQASDLSSVAEIYRALSDTTLSILEAASNAGLDDGEGGTASGQ